QDGRTTPFAHPIAEEFVQVIGMLGPRAPTGEPRLLDDLGVPNPGHDTFCGLLRTGRDRDPVTISRHVGVSGSIVLRAVAGPRAHDAQLLVSRRRRPHGSHDWLENAHVYDLPASSQYLTRPERH